MYTNMIVRISPRITKIISTIAMVTLSMFPLIMNAAVTNNGTLIYGDTTNAGTVKVRLFTNPSTYGAEVSGPTTTNTSNIIHVVSRFAPTRDEAMVGILKVDGLLHIFTCTGSTGCDASAEFTARWNNPGTTGTQDCDSAPTLGTCTQAFDIGYETLSGRAMVVYGDNVTDKIYYALWDGTSWSPNASPGSPGATNEVNLPGTAGTPRWIRVIPAGEQLASSRSNRAMVLVADSNDDLFAFYWNGSSFDGGSTLSTTLGNCDRARCFDGNWQATNTFIASYTNSGVNEVRYQKYTVSGGWEGDTQAYTTASTPAFIVSAADPTSSRIVSMNTTSANDTRAAVWRADDATDGWTVCASGGCPDTSTEAFGGAQGWFAFERFNGEGLFVFNDAANGTAQGNERITYTPTNTWSTVTVTGITPSDDHQSTKIIPSPNSDDIMIIAADVDCDVDAVMWNGSGFGTVSSNFELVLSSSNNTCANSVPIAGMMTGHGYDMLWRAYSPWARNWRWYNGTDTAATPTTALANENTTPTGFDAVSGKARLRYSVIELTSGSAQTDARKKLQYTTGDPDDDATSWTDVDDVGGAGQWRYVDCNGGTSTCDDNTALSGTVLTGSPTAGWWTQDKDAAGGTAMDHNAGQLRELEYSIEANSADPGTTYYFRMYDVDQQTPVFREQDNDGSNDCATATCTYPSLTTQAAVAPTVLTNFATPGQTTALLSGTKTSGDTASQHGFAYSTDSSLITGVSTTTLGSVSGNNSFTNNISSLSTNTTYYFRAYVTNAGGTAYGTIKSFVTGNTTPTRTMHLFEGFRIKLLNGKIKLLQR